MIEVNKDKFLEELKKYKLELENLQSLSDFTSRFRSFIKYSFGVIPPQFESILEVDSVYHRLSYRIINYLAGGNDKSEEQKQQEYFQLQKNSIKEQLDSIINNFELGIITLTKKEDRISISNNFQGCNNTNIQQSTGDNNNLTQEQKNNEQKQNSILDKLEILNKFIDFLKKYWHYILGLGSPIICFWNNINQFFIEIYNFIENIFKGAF